MNFLEREIKIGNNVYMIVLLDSEAAFDTLGEVSPLFLPLAGVLGDEIMSIDDKLETTILTALTTSITYAMTQPRVREFLKGLLFEVYKNGAKIQAKEVPFKDYMDLMVFAVKETYLDFILGRLSSMGIEITSLEEAKAKLADIFNKPSKTSNEDVVSESPVDSSST